MVKSLYWTSTLLVAAGLVASALAYLMHRPTMDGVRALGFPDSFRVQLAVMKLICALVLIVPFAPWPLREWACAGVALFIVTAIVAHTAHGDPFAVTVVNLAMLALLGASRATAARALM